MSEAQSKLSVITDGREDLELELVEKLKMETINESELDQLLKRLNVRRGHLKFLSNSTIQ
jgi:hypothetical protein